MGRSNRKQADENRLRILEHADAALRSGGVSAINIVDIMTSAGLTKGGFYNHFASKEALIVEACASGFAESVQNWNRAALPTGLPAAGALNRLVAHYLASKAPEQRCLMVALGQDAASNHVSHSLSTAYREGVEQLLSTFIGIAHADPTCLLTDEQLRLAFSAMVGVNMLARATRDSAWPATMQQTLVELPTR